MYAFRRADPAGLTAADCGEGNAGMWSPPETVRSGPLLRPLPLPQDGRDVNALPMSRVTSQGLGWDGSLSAVDTIRVRVLLACMGAVLGRSIRRRCRPRLVTGGPVTVGESCTFARALSAMGL